MSWFARCRDLSRAWRAATPAGGHGVQPMRERSPAGQRPGLLMVVPPFVSLNLVWGRSWPGRLVGTALPRIGQSARISYRFTLGITVVVMTFRYTFIVSSDEP